MTPDQVTACLVTRGDVDMQPIMDSLIFDDILVWDNSVEADMKTAGRYYAIMEADSEVVYLQDDDVIVPAETQRLLLEAYEPGVCVANYGHGDNPDGYDDMPLVHGGAVVDRDLPLEAIKRYLAVWPHDSDFLYEADFVAGILYPAFKHLELPMELRDVCFAGNRMCDQPWQRELKKKITDRARAIRDSAMVAA